MEKTNRVIDRTADIIHDLAYNYDTKFEAIHELVGEQVYSICSKVDRHFNP